MSVLSDRSQGALAAAMGISEQEVARRKLFLEVGDDDADRLTSVTNSLTRTPTR